MEVSKGLILELQTIIREDYGQEVDFQHTSAIADDLVGYFNILAQIYHQQNKHENEQPN